MTRVKMAKYVHLQMWLFCHLIWKTFCNLDRANSIQTAFQTCNLVTRQSVSYKSVNWFCLNLAPQMATKISFANGYILPFRYFAISTFVIIKEMASCLPCNYFESLMTLVRGTLFTHSVPNYLQQLPFDRVEI